MTKELSMILTLVATQVHTGSLASVRCAAHPFLQYDNIEVSK